MQEEVLVEDYIMIEAQELDELRQEFVEAEQQVKKLWHDRETLNFHIGEQLCIIYDNQGYRYLDERYEQTGGFGKYTEEQLGIHYRKARHFMNIYQVFKRFPDAAIMVNDIGWSKAARLASVVAKATDMSDDEFLGLIDYCKEDTTTVKGLEDKLQREYSTTPLAKQKTVSFKGFKLPEDRADTIKEYLDELEKHFKADSYDECMEYIITVCASEVLHNG